MHHFCHSGNFAEFDRSVFHMHTACFSFRYLPCCSGIILKMYL